MDTHPPHPTTCWHGWSLLPHVGVSDDGLGGEEESADGSGVLQGAAGDLRRMSA
ncbi:MAG: hypothetical protein WCR44_08325 [Verrucomicrobiota bacterium]